MRRIVIIDHHWLLREFFYISRDFPLVHPNVYSRKHVNNCYAMFTNPCYHLFLHINILMAVEPSRISMEKDQVECFRVSNICYLDNFVLL